MDQSYVITTLRHHRNALQARGVRHAALFGSLARNAAGPQSDIDILVEFDPEARITVYDYVGVRQYISGLFDGPVDVVDCEALKPQLRASSARDAVYAF